MTLWTYDETELDLRTIPLADIHLVPPDERHGGDRTREIRTIDLRGAQVSLDVDDEGNIVSIGIIGPCVFVNLENLGEYLKEPPTVLKAEE